MYKEIPYLKSAEALPNYKLHLEFADGVKGDVDLSYIVGKGVFSFWNDEENFKNYIINDMNKLEWENEIDMDPDAFYLKIINKTFFEYARD
jgi:hypothetical protein